MEINKNISAPFTGMNRDSNLDRLQDGEFTFALNSDSNGRVRHNEPSNYLYTVFPQGHRVIGLLKDNLQERTYYWLTNPETEFSSFGYIIDRKTEHNNIETETTTGCTDCDEINLLGTPLENTVQTPEFEYVELFHDRCLPKGEGLNFHIDFPIKRPVLKSEITSTTVYWEDNRNRPRYVKVDDVSYLYEEDIPCEDSQETPCLQVHKLLQFPNSTPIEVEAVSQNTGGNLRRGSYEIFVAYSDEFGAEMSEYSSGTNAIKIFDINNSVLESRDLDNTTNYAIKVRVNNLDYKNFRYYKVVVVERGVLDSTQIAYQEGIYPTTTTELVITSSGRLYTDIDRDTLLNPKKVVELNTLFSRRPKIEKAVGEAIIGNRKYIHGVKRKETLNIQPIVNLFSPLAEWQTVLANESLYEDGVVASKYGSYMRDEVQPFSLRLINKDGSKSDNFIMMSRPPRESDLEIMSDEYIKEFSDSGCVDTERIYKWQYINTARELSQCDADIETIEVQQNDSRSCIIENVFTIPANEITIELDSDFTTLQNYLEDNEGIYIPEITPYLDPEAYSDSHCEVNFGVLYTSGELIIGKNYIIREVEAGDDFSNVGFTTQGGIFTATATTPNSWVNGTEVEETFCSIPEITNSNVEIVEVIGEVVDKKESTFPNDYSRISSTNTCNIYSRGDDGKFIRNDDFAWEFDSWSYFGGSDRRLIYQREYSFFNESCPTSETIQWLTPGGYLQRYWFNHIGGINREDIETNKRSQDNSTEFESDGVSGFSSYIANSSLWFVGNTGGKNKFILEVTRALNLNKTDNNILNRNPQQKVRISIFNRCSDQEARFSIVHHIANRGLQLLIEIEDDNLKITDDNGEETLFTGIPNIFPSNNFFVVVEPFIVKTTGKVRGENDDEEEVLLDIWTDKVRTVPPNGCFSIALRDVEYTEAKVSWDSILLSKTEEYVASCTYNIPKDLNCDPIPYKKGEFSYWESTVTYPDNKELFDSSVLKIRPEHLNFQPYSLRSRFESYFTESLLDNEGNYVLKDVDFRCKPIRHYKFPDNRVAPFTSPLNLPNGSDTHIYPIGINLDARVVRSMLVVALENNLITQEQFDNVVGFEVLKGDNLYSRSVVANGLMFDMYKYQDKGEDIYYSNFPYNGLGEDMFHRELTNDSNIPHPFNSRGNNKFTFISPDLLYTNTTLPNELSIQGFVRGFANSNFVELKDHAKWTILGRRARRTANTLAWAEFAIESAISIGTITGSQWFLAGLAGGTSLGLVGTAIVTAANLASGFSKVGNYRYQWLETFRNLGAKYNFGYYGYSKAEYNTFIPNRNNTTVLNRLYSTKYLPSGHFSILDKGTKETYKINNYLRERSVFLSTGEKEVTYPPDYYQIDISTNNRFSGTTSGRIDCENSFTSSVASPYGTLKNYVPNQYGEIGGISWIATGKQLYFGQDYSCEPIFGGDVSISRFYYRRKIPIFTQTAFNEPDKTTFEYSAHYNVARAKFYCDYETDTEYNDLLIPFPDIDSEYNMDCQSPSSRFYVKRGKIYTAYYSFPGFLVESRMNLNWRYAGKDIKEQFVPLQSDLETYTQEKNISIREQEQILYSETYSLANTRTNTTVLPYSYNKEFYRKISENTNEVIWSEPDLSEVSREQDPWLVYKPLNTFAFETKNGNLKSLKESTSNTAVGRFTDGMQVFNTVDSLAERITPQTQDLGTGGIFTQSRPISFVNSSLGFSGTQHYNIIETEFGDVHIDSERGQVLLLNNQANGLEDITYSFQGQPTNISKWFKRHLPFKIKKFFPEIDVDNPFKDIGISGGYDSVNKRAFITKKDYIPTTDCVQWDEDLGLVLNETKCSGQEQVPSCPEGFEYNEVTGMCEKTNYTLSCPIGYHLENGVCVSDIGDDCKTDLVLVIDNSSSIVGVEINQVKTFLTAFINTINQDILSDKVRVGIVSFTSVAETHLGLSNSVEDIIQIIQNLDPPTGLTNTIDGMCNGRSVLIGSNSRTTAKKNMIIITDGTQNTPIFCPDAVNNLPPATAGVQGALTYSEKLKNVDDIYITLVAVGGFQEEIDNVACQYGGSCPSLFVDYPMPSVGGGLYGRSFYTAFFENATAIVGDISQTVCSDTTPVVCNDCDFNEEVGMCECFETAAPTFVDVRTPIEVTDENYFEDVSWTIAFKFEDKGWNSYHSFTPNFYNPHQDFFQTGYNSNNSKLWSHTLEDNSFQVFQGVRKPFIVETVVTNKNTSKFLNSIAIESEAVRYQDGNDFSQWWDKGFDTLTIYNNTDNSGRLKLTPLKNYRDLTKYPINNPDNTQTITFVPQDEKQVVNYFYNRTRREDRNIPQWINDRNQIMKDVNPRAVKFTGKQLLERLRGNSFIIRLENESESRFKLNLKDVIIEETNYQG